jgi:magnesium transporter
MIQKYTYKRLTWIDLESPTSDEVAKVMNDYKLHPLVAEELLQKSLKPKVDFYNDYIYLILHIPVRTKNEVKDQEVDFIIGKEFIITTKYDTVEPLHNFSKMFEVNSILDKSGIGEHAGFIFYHMIKRLYKNMAHELDAIRGQLIQAEKHIFAGNEKNMVRELSNLSRELIDFKQSTRMHHSILEDFATVSRGFFGESFEYYTEDIQSEFTKVHDMMLNNKELVTDLRDTNDSLLSTKQNEAIKTLTMLAFATFPLTLIASIFALDTTHKPIVGMTYDFEIIIGIMLIVLIGIFSYFKYKKWL